MTPVVLAQVRQGDGSLLVTIGGIDCTQSTVVVPADLADTPDWRGALGALIADQLHRLAVVEASTL